MRSRSRRALAVTCVALIVFTGFLPLGAVSVDWLVFTPAFTLLAPTATSTIPRQTEERNEQILALLAILDSRGPPSTTFSLS